MPVTKEPVYASKAQPWMSFYDPKYRDMPVPDCTAFEYVCRQNKGHLADIALNYYGTNITYATFIVNVKKTAAALRAAGVRKGDIMTAVSVMTPELIYLFYASDMVGATLNLVDPRYSPEGILNVSADFEDRTREGSMLDQYLGVAQAARRKVSPALKCPHSSGPSSQPLDPIRRPCSRPGPTSMESGWRSAASASREGPRSCAT